MIDVISDKTRGPKSVALKNRKRVKNWFLDNPGHTVAECSRALNLRWQTVKNHVIAIQKGE